MSQPVLPDVKISSFAAPTEDDIAVWNALSDDEKRAMLDHEIEKGAASGISDKSMDDIWHEALKRAGQVPDHAL